MAVLSTISTGQALLWGLGGLLFAWVMARSGRRAAERELRAMGITDVPRGRVEWRPRDEEDLQSRRSPGGYVRWLVRERLVTVPVIVGAGVLIYEGPRPALVAVGLCVVALAPLGYLGWRYRWWRTLGWYE